MPSYYKPDESSIPSSLWETVLLSQRDVSFQVPINYITRPAISLTAACFGDKTYEDESTAICISNLLSVGYQRLIVDLYWSPKRKQWTFCPVAIPLDAVGATGNPATAVSSAPSAALSSGIISDVGKTSTSTTSLSTTTSTSGSDTRATNNPDKRVDEQLISATVTAAPASGDQSSLLYELGPYSCTHTLDLSMLINVVFEYFGGTANTLQARLLFLVFNIHSAADVEDPERPVKIPDDELPGSDQLLGSIIDATLGTYMYSPSQLQEERGNLNMSWYETPDSYYPIAEYFTTNEDERGVHSTPDGWPCGKYVEIQKAKRLLLGWGTIDDELGKYNFENDEGLVFGKDTLTTAAEVDANQGGTIESGCLYDPDSLDVPIQASWSQSTKINGFESSMSGSDMSPLSNLSKNLKFCGISPLITETLSNVSAKEDIRPYRDISHSIWFWASGEPYSPPNSDPDNNYRCALMDTTLSGNWRATDCSKHYYAACRVDNSPYSWVLTSDKTSFGRATGACPENTTFGVPRTGLEQTHLAALLTKSNSTLDLSSPDGDSSGIWVNFNSLDVQYCWVTGGPNATCPYYEDQDAAERRQIVVPTVAAIIVLIITALTLFVKCNANRRNSRRKRRVIEGWEYEGVPS
ncbi:hypothetical protein FQN54_004160 [Arachnomyces sp. PD_36]|nr:hypothetical protein FQN54_004160 [Arachnomyces sp. PD_36]